MENEDFGMATEEVTKTETDEKSFSDNAEQTISTNDWSIPVPDDDQVVTPESSKQPKNNIFSAIGSTIKKAFDWTKEKVAGAIHAIRDKIPSIGKEGGFLSRLETRVLGGKEAYNKLYSRIDVTDAAKDPQNQISNIIKAKAEAEKTESEKTTEKKEKPEFNITVQNEDFNKRYSAIAKTMVDKTSQASKAVYALRSVDRLSDYKVPGAGADFSKSEAEHVKSNTETFKEITDSLSEQLKSGKLTPQILKDNPYTIKDGPNKGTYHKGTFDLGEKGSVTVTFAEKENGFNLRMVNEQTKASVEIKGAESFLDAVSQASELLAASEISMNEIESQLEEMSQTVSEFTQEDSLDYSVDETEFDEGEDLDGVSSDNEFKTTDEQGNGVPAKTDAEQDDAIDNGTSTEGEFKTATEEVKSLGANDEQTTKAGDKQGEIVSDKTAEGDTKAEDSPEIDVKSSGFQYSIYELSTSDIIKTQGQTFIVASINFGETFDDTITATLKPVEFDASKGLYVVPEGAESITLDEHQIKGCSIEVNASYFEVGSQVILENGEKATYIGSNIIQTKSGRTFDVSDQVLRGDPISLDFGASSQDENDSLELNESYEDTRGFDEPATLPDKSEIDITD